ncbi:MAG: hypothetical protein HY327_11355 [Chloroflexi bacterium]|nr:hypothetical protein [Chloroflexota bacterium]
MDESVLSPWRDLAIVILAIQAIVLVAVPGIAFYYALRGVRWLRARMIMPLKRAQLGALRVQRGALRWSEIALALPLAVESANARVRTTARGLFDLLRGAQ